MTKLVPSVVCLVLGLTLLGFVTSCDSNTMLRIQTDIPELALLADRYQAITGKPSIIIEYQANPASNPASGNTPDLIIGHGLYNQPSLDTLSSQKDLFQTNPLNPSDFYSFTFIKQKGDYRLTVLSWDLPAIITRTIDTSQDFSEGVVLPLDNLREKGVQFNTRKKGSLHTLGFSPLYAPEFLYLTAQLHGAHLSADYRGYPSWDEDGLGKGLSYLKDWSTRFNGGVDQEIAFLDKYAYDPVYQLLHQGRFSFAYTHSSDFLRQPQSVSQGLSLHWPSLQDKLLILDNFVAAGIPRQSVHKTEALAFIRWLLQDDVQSKSIADTLDSGLYSFGFLQGFSSRRLVNEKTIPYYFPLVRLRIPPDSMLVFPQIQGIHWEDFKTTVFAPWFHRQLQNNSRNLASFKSAGKQWLLHLGLDP